MHITGETEVSVATLVRFFQCVNAIYNVMSQVYHVELVVTFFFSHWVLDFRQW